MRKENVNRWNPKYWIVALYRFYLEMIREFVRLGDWNRRKGSTKGVLFGAWQEEFFGAWYEKYLAGLLALFSIWVVLFLIVLGVDGILNR